MRFLDSALAIMTVFQTITRHYNRGGNGCLEQLAPIIHRFGAFRAAYVRAFDNEGEGFWSELITSEGVCAKFWQFLASRSGEFWAEHVNVGVQSIVEDAQKQDPKCLEDFLVANACTLRLEVLESLCQIAGIMPRYVPYASAPRLLTHTRTDDDMFAGEAAGDTFKELVIAPRDAVVEFGGHAAQPVPL